MLQTVARYMGYLAIFFAILTAGTFMREETLSPLWFPLTLVMGGLVVVLRMCVRKISTDTSKGAEEE